MRGALRVLGWLAPLAFFAFLGRELQKTLGSYHFEALLGTAGFWLVCVALLFASGLGRSRLASAQNGRPAAQPGDWLTAAASSVLVFNALRIWDNPVIDGTSDPVTYARLTNLVTLALALSVALGVWALYNVAARAPRRTGRGFWVLAGLAWAAWLGAKILTPVAVRHPFIDCFTIATEAADYFLGGRNPYPQHYADIYHGYYNYPPGFTYWPGLLYPQALARALTGDVRNAFVGAEVLAAVGLVGTLRRLGAPRPLWALVPLCWISFPVGLFVLQNSWIDSLLIGAGALVAWAVASRSWLALGLALGWFCSIKQYGFFLAMPLALVIHAQAGTRELVRVTLIALAVFAAILGPFIWLDAGAFFQSTLGMLMEIGIRRDSLSIPAALQNEWGYTISGLWMGLSVLGALGGACLWTWLGRGRLAAWSGSLILAYGATFLMGKQAFCNYYYLLAFFALLAFVFRWEPEAGVAS